MRSLSLLSMLLMLFFSASALDNSDLLSKDSLQSDPGVKEIPEFNTDTIQQKVIAMGLPLDTKYTNIVEAYIRGYVMRNRPKSELILGKTILYFPIFEKKLKESGVPTDLKYLSVVESALDPIALSRVGAKGLWQFMPETGKYYGLDISEYIDERCDPDRSTDAAIAYLKRQYERYEDWALAIAAYNSGPGRVNKAIKRARSKNFWKIARFLPKETRNYVPAYIAAAYLMKHYDDHLLEPNYPGFDYQLTESTMVYQTLSFYTLAQITGLAMDVIRNLNPTYVEDFIPQSIKGHKVVLPSRVMSSLKDYLAVVKPDIESDYSLEGIPVYATTPEEVDQMEFYSKSIYTVGEDDNLNELAKLFRCPEHCLIAWNGLANRELVRGQDLILYQPKNVKRFSLTRENENVPEGIPGPSLKSINLARNGTIHHESAASPELNNFYFYQLKMGESLQEVILKFPNNTLKDLIKLNEINPANPPLAGATIKVRKL
ncbi:MAG: transglycosylase SLT domain-containing protein [Saprospiraceae bacterium]